jgi:hypothetical protein
MKTSEASGSLNPTTQHNIPEDQNPQISPCLLTLYLTPYRWATELINYGSHVGADNMHSLAFIQEAGIHSSGY